MIKWEDLDCSANINPAFPCNINRGIMDDVGNPVNLPAHIYVDDAIMLSPNADHIKMVLAAMIELIFVVMGEPEEELRQCPMAMDKWRDLPSYWSTADRPPGLDNQCIPINRIDPTEIPHQSAITPGINLAPIPALI